jgi:hypothetical protein
MESINILLARTIWLMETRLVNPGLAFRPTMEAIVERYKFCVYPTKPEHFDSSVGVRYQNGVFEFEGRQIAIFFTVYDTGWMADTLVSTRASDAFLRDLDAWIVSEQGYRSASGAITKITHESQLEFHSDLIAEKSCEKIREFTQLLAKVTGNAGERISALTFKPEGSSYPTFSFERREGAPYVEKKYFSRALLETETHFAILGEFEKLFSDS